jgi:hypothetical protein
LMRMFYYAPGPIMWVTPLSAFATPVPPTAYYYPVPQYYVPPPAAPVEPLNYGMPIMYGAPYATYGTYPCEPCYYPQAAAPSLPRGEYRFGRCLMIC